jgi:hypothetical protein
MGVEVNEFWDAFEKETGEKVEARSLGEWYETEGDIGLWGLLILTDKSFRFRHMPSDNWMTSLFKRGDKNDKREPVNLRVAREDIVSLNVPKRGFFAKLIEPAFPRFSIVARGAGGETRHSFSVDPGSGLLAALERALERATGSATEKKDGAE